MSDTAQDINKIRGEMVFYTELPSSQKDWTLYLLITKSYEQPSSEPARAQGRGLQVLLQSDEQ